MRAKDYIEATYALLSKGADVALLLTNLQSVLNRKGLTSLYPRILRGLSEKLARKERTTRTRIVVAREADLTRHKEEIDAALTAIGATGEPTTHIDTTIVGGFVATAENRRIDRSYKSILLQAYHNVVE